MTVRVVSREPAGRGMSVSRRANDHCSTPFECANSTMSPSATISDACEVAAEAPARKRLAAKYRRGAFFVRSATPQLPKKLGP
jgi:hypothetical protein